MSRRRRTTPRKTWTALQDARGGCFTCNGYDAIWFSRNALGLAALHHDHTGHPTWAEQVTAVWYGDPPPSHSDAPVKP